MQQYNNVNENAPAKGMVIELNVGTNIEQYHYKQYQ